MTVGRPPFVYGTQYPAKSNESRQYHEHNDQNKQDKLRAADHHLHLNLLLERTLFSILLHFFKKSIYSLAIFLSLRKESSSSFKIGLLRQDFFKFVIIFS